MKIIHARDAESIAEARTSTFTGTVWGDPLMPATDGVLINTVYFAPCSRTYWHRHEGGQLLQVVSGQGWVATREDGAVRVEKGDTIWTPPGQEHWHGSDEHTMFAHVATSLGRTEWFGEVEAEEFARFTEEVRAHA